MLEKEREKRVSWDERIERIRDLGSDEARARLDELLEEILNLDSVTEAGQNKETEAEFSLEEVVRRTKNASLHFFQSGGIYELLAARDSSGLRAWGESRTNRSQHKFAGYVARLEDQVPEGFLDAYPELRSKGGGTIYDRDPLSESKLAKPFRAKAAIFGGNESVYLVVAGFLGYDQRGRSNHGSLVLELDGVGADQFVALIKANRETGSEDDSSLMRDLLKRIFGEKLPTDYSDGGSWGPFASSKRALKIEEIKDLRNN